MALISCPECHKEISDSAEFCPHCGYKFITKEKKTESESFLGKDDSNVLLIIGIVCLFVFPLAGIIILLIALNNARKNKKAKEKKKQERTDMEKILIKQAKIDALASIDPKDTKKSKEQIDIVNKLDDLE